jgi:hypothetical protein
LYAKPVSRKPHLSIWAAKSGLQQEESADALIAKQSIIQSHTNVNFFSSSTICIRSVLAFCEETASGPTWPLAIPFGFSRAVDAMVLFIQCCKWMVDEVKERNVDSEVVEDQ